MQTFLFDVERDKVGVDGYELDGELFDFWMDMIVPSLDVVQEVVTDVLKW